MNKYYYYYFITIILFIIYPLLTAQVPFEYFELSSLEPPQTQSASAFSEPSLMPPHLFLDSQTQAAGDLTLSEPFAPPVGNHIRRRVYSHIEVKDDSRLIYIVPDPSPCVPWKKKKAPKDYVLHRSALVYRESDGVNAMDIPGDFPEMLITSFQSYHEADNTPANEVTLLKCPDDTYAVSSSARSKYRFEYETVSLPGASEPKAAEFFIGKKCSPSAKETADVERLLEELVKNAPALADIRKKKNPIYELIRYFQSFSSEHLTGVTDDSAVSMELVQQMLWEKKGLCRHRAIMMVLAARAMGCSARIAANEIHAFVELKMDGHWYPVELGGDARSLTIQPTSPRLAAKTVSNYSFLDDDKETAKTVSNYSFVDDAKETGENHSGSPLTVEVKVQKAGASGGSDTVDSVVAHGEHVRFIPETRLPVMTRDVDIQFSGTFVNNLGLPLRGREILVELSRGERRVSLQVRTEADGKCRFTVRLPADWPLGATNVSWTALEKNRRAGE
ncbi:MAG: hypothetical protein IJU23_03670 [Proteobacteria bacterium]|nr:hypothetical protein [Pseudomonadota bacterium]